MIRYATMLFCAYSAVAIGASLDVSKVNGSIHVEDGREAGDVSTVNGSITIGAAARVRDVETVNGSVHFEDRSQARSAETVNGAIELGAQVRVADSVSAVNGSMTLGSGASVGGALENVNGRMNLQGAAVGGGIETVNGDITVGAGSRVDGGIHVERSKGWGWTWKPSRNPAIRIESGAVVTGPLNFEREVDLYVGQGVALGPVEGVQPKRYPIQ